MINILLWWYEQDLYFVNCTHHNAYRNLLFKVIHWCRRTVCSKFPNAVQSYPKCLGNFGQQYFSFLMILNFMPYNLNMENIIIHNKTRDMLPSISSTILHARYSELANSKSVQSSPIWRYYLHHLSVKMMLLQMQKCFVCIKFIMMSLQVATLSQWVIWLDLCKQSIMRLSSQLKI